MPVAPKIYSEDEIVSCRWYPVEQVRKMVQSGRIADIITFSFLHFAGIITSEAFGWVDITPAVQDVSQ